MSLASQGTVLATARTRPFDVVTHENYVAPRKILCASPHFSDLADADRVDCFTTALTHLTQSFFRQGARIQAFPPNTP